MTRRVDSKQNGLFHREKIPVQRLLPFPNRTPALSFGNEIIGVVVLTYNFYRAELKSFIGEVLMREIAR
jgi:hypothetical protein